MHVVPSEDYRSLSEARKLVYGRRDTGGNGGEARLQSQQDLPGERDEKSRRKEFLKGRRHVLKWTGGVHG